MTRSTVNRNLAGLIALTIFVSGAPGVLSGQRAGDDGVLRSMIAGTRALSLGDTANAAHFFDGVTTAIAGIWGGTPEAAKARKLWYAESVKPFRGEAYERMMAFYYRGVLYLQGGDFGNAQAAFQMSIQQDAFADEEQFQSDVTAPLLLLGLSLQAQGSASAANEAFAALRARRPELPVLDGAAPPPSALLIVETGTSPRKVSDGLNAEKMKIFRGKNFTERMASVSADNAAPATLWPMEDIYFQASTRGGRPIDFLLKGKAKYATTTSGLGNAFADLGSALSIQFSYQQSVTYASGGGTSLTLSNARAGADVMEALGAVVSLVGAFVNPAADVRYWDNLPDAVHILPVALTPGVHSLAIHFYSADGTEVTELKREMSVTIPTERKGPVVVWVSSRPRDSMYAPQARR